MTKYYFNVPFLPLENYKLTKEFIDIIPKEFAIENNLIILDKFIGYCKILIIATSKPRNEYILKTLEYITGCLIREVEVSQASLELAIQNEYC